MNKLKNKYVSLSPKERLHQCPNPVIGLTGGIATGKSTVSQIMKDNGLWVICADDLIHKIYNETQTLEKVRQLCPDSIRDNEIDFKILRKLFFSDSKLKSELENFLYQSLPRVFKEALPQDKEQVVIYDVPLLFEKNLESSFDQIIAVITTEEIQLHRLEKRDGDDRETHASVIKNQWPLSKKKANSDFVIENNGDLSELKIRVLHLLSELLD